MRQNPEPQRQKTLPVLALQYRTREDPARPERMRTSTLLRSFSNITLQKRACDTVSNGMELTIRRTPTSPLNDHSSFLLLRNGKRFRRSDRPSGHRSSSLVVTGKRFKRSDRFPVDRDGKKTSHSHNSEKRRGQFMNREKTTPLDRAVNHRQSYGKLDDEKKENGCSSEIHDRNGAT